MTVVNYLILAAIGVLLVCLDRMATEARRWREYEEERAHGKDGAA